MNVVQGRHQILGDSSPFIASPMNSKVRFVRCPRCRQVLPEPEVPVYECGGCGTFLKAKNWRNEPNSTGLHLRDTDLAQRNELEHVSEDNEASSFNQHVASPSMGESGWRSAERDQNKFGDCNGESPGGRNFSNQFPSSTELSCHENEGSSPEARGQMELIEDRCPLEQYNQSEFGVSNREQPGGMNFSNKVCSSTVLSNHGNRPSLPGGRAYMEVDECENCLEQTNGRDQNEFGDCIGDWPGNVKISMEVPSSSELTCHEIEEPSPVAGADTEVDENSSEQNNGRDLNEFGDCMGDSPGNVKNSMELPSSTKLTCHKIEEPSPVAGADTEVDENFKTRFIVRSSSGENLLAVRPRDEIISSQRPLGESIVSENLTSPCNEQLGQSQKSIQLNRVSSVDALESIPLIDPSSDLTATLRDMPKSPTTRSYYAYDGSVSSYDGTDDQVPHGHLHQSKRRFKDTDLVSTKGLPRRGERMVNNFLISSESEMQHQAMNPSISPRKKHYAMKGKWHRGELREPTRHSHLVRNKMRLDGDERLPGPPFCSRGSQPGHRNGSPSSYRQSEFQHQLSFQRPDKPRYPEPDKMELIRMVYDLQDQLHRTYISKGKENERFPAGVARKEKQISSYYESTSEREICPDLNYPRYPGRYSQGKCWALQCKTSRMAFSGEATHTRDQADCSCLHCCPIDLHCSAQLPPHVIYCNKGQHTAHPSHNYYHLCCSTPSSPQHYSGSSVSLWSHDAKSDDQQHKDLEVKMLYQRERHHSMKRHLRPIAGGAPIIACYRCLELLQLPADFLLFKSRCHQLRCSACSEVLKFSLQDKAHIVPYIPDTIAPPPSEADDYSNAINRRNLASTSHVKSCSHAEPVSCSDDYGQSFCRSCSTDGDPYSTSFHKLKRNSSGRKMSSSSSFDPVEDIKKKSVFRESQNKFKNPVEIFESAGHSPLMSKREKISSEIEELPERGGSPLHRLMGYSCPSDVMNR